MSGAPAVRPLTAGEVGLVQPLGQRAFADLARRTGREPEPYGPDVAAHYVAQHRHLHVTDPDGCLGALAAPDGPLLGAALAYRRGGLWVLALLVVDPAAQSAGTGTRLLAAALTTAAPGEVRILHASRDARAMRGYARAGFRLLPALTAAGRVDTARLGDRSGVVDVGGPDGAQDGNLARAAGLAGVAHLAVDLQHALGAGGRLLVSAAGRPPGCAVVTGPPGSPYARVLTAADPDTGRRLLRAALAAAAQREGTVFLGPLTAQQHWAVDVALEARLDLAPAGPVAVAGPGDLTAGTGPPPAVLI